MRWILRFIKLKYYYPNSVDYTKCVRDLQRKGTEYVESTPKPNDYKIASIVAGREIHDRVLSAFQRAKTGEEDVAERYEALFHVWNIIHMRATKNQGQPVTSLDQETTNLIPPTEGRDVSEVKAAINLRPTTDERHAYEDQAMLNSPP